MDSTSSPDPATVPFESGMPRLVLQLGILSGGIRTGCGLLRTLPMGGTSSVWSVAYSPDGRHIISGSYDGTIRVWDAETIAAVGNPLKGHVSLVRSVGYSPDGRHIISASDDGTIRIWGAETGAEVCGPFHGHN